MLYFIIIFLSATVLSLVNIFCFADCISLEAWQIILLVAIYVLWVIAVDAIIAILVKMIPANKIQNAQKLFKIFNWEGKYYKSIGIKKWKDKIPEWGRLSNFSKSTLADPKNNEYIKRFIVESKYGEIIHLLSMIFGFIIVFPLKFALNFGLPVAIINALLNYPSFCILRYNRPKLEVIYKMNARQEERKKRKTEAVE